MKRKLRSSVPCSAEELLSSAESDVLSKSGRSKIKSLILSFGPSSGIVSSLPSALHVHVNQSLDSLKQYLKLGKTECVAAGGGDRSSCSPPFKSFKHSSRLKRSNDQEGEATLPEPGSETLNVLKKLRAYAYITHLCISHPKSIFSPSDLFATVQSLHSSLVLYDDHFVQSEVASLCEKWWKEDFPGREILISQSLPYLLSKSVAEGKKTDVHRVYILREAFTLFDYDDDSIEDLRLLIVRCVISPVYLKTKEGRGFVAFILGLNRQLLKEALVLIRSQIPFGKKSVLEGYAEILFKAWRGSVDFTKEEIENGFLQGLVEGAIFAQNKQLASSIRRVLSGFVCQRATSGVDKLLYRLAEPLLFRSLQVANSNVRHNAVLLFLDLFPIEDPDVTKEEKDILLEKQYFLLQKILMDECPEVRAVTVEGLCRILNLFWEVIPSSTIIKLLGKVIDDMGSDICNEVRLSTVNGIIYLLENPQSHEIMKVILPRLGYLLSDPCLSVRVSAADLLLEVGQIRTFQLNKVVSLDSLFSSLADDHERVARKLTRLLIPSYLPSKVTPKVACNRFFTLMRRAPIAGARFCEFALSEGSSLKTLMELLRFSLGLVLNGSGLSSGQIDGLITASANICTSITTELSNKTILELFSGDKLVRLLSAATSVQAQIAVLGIASMVSPDDLGELHDRCIIFVIECTDLSDDQERKGLIRAVHRLMLACGWFDELVEILTCILKTIAASFLANFSADVPHQIFQSLKKKHKLPMKISTKIGFLNGKGSKVPDKSKIKKAFSLAAGIAWQLKELIVNVDMRKTLLQSPNLEDAFYSLKIISQIFIEQCVNFEFFDTSPIVSLATLSLYLSLENDDSVIVDDDIQSGSECMSSHVKYRILDNTLSNLLNWVEKIFDRVVVGQSGISPSRMKHNVDIPWQQPSRQKAGYDLNSHIPEAKGIENAMELCTSILKFIADIAAMNLVGHNDIGCLRFASAFARYAVSTIGGYRREVSSFKVDDLKEIFEYLKSSFTYAAKFLHMVLQHSSGFSSVPVEAFYLSNDLLDLVTAIEPYFGLKHAYQMISIAKPWLPVLLLGLGCHQLTRCTHQSDQPSFIDPGWHHYPTWLAVVSKAELREISKAKDGDNGGKSSEPEASAFTKLILTAVAMLQKGNPSVLDAIGCVLLVGLDVGLHARDFGLLFGLVHFIFVKLLGKEFTLWKELEQMTAYLQEIYPRFENELANPSLDEEEREKLEAAMELLSSFFMNSG